MGTWLAMPLQRAVAAGRWRFAAHGGDPRRVALGLQGDLSAGGSLRGPRVSNPAARQAPAGRELENAVDSAGAIGRIQSPHAVKNPKRELSAECRFAGASLAPRAS